MRRDRRAAKIRPVKARSAGWCLALFAIVFALVLKGAIPLFASWSAHLQGKGVAEVCDVYGVTVPGADGHAMHAMHGAHAMHGMPTSSQGSGDAPNPHDPGRHAGDHCALGALVGYLPASTSRAA